MKKVVKELLFSFATLESLWAAFRSDQLHRDYLKRREMYFEAASRAGLSYSLSETVNAVRSRLRERGYSPARRKLGEIHTFAFIPKAYWHENLLPDLWELGPVTEFNYLEHGFGQGELRSGSARESGKREEMNDVAFETLKRAHSERPVDWFFAYANGSEIGRKFLRRIRDELGIPTVTMCLDDKQSWFCNKIDGQYAGQADIASEFDLSWSSARIACEWYMVEGGRPVYLPEGFDCNAYHPSPISKDIALSFVGAAYGRRRQIVSHLRNYGVPIEAYGHGWSNGTLSWEEQIRVFNRSIINLGIGGIGYSEELTNVKGRDFDVPGTGGGVYLTTFNPDLAQHFVIGEEILCYRTREELVELARHYISRPEEADLIARRGRERCLREHRWLHRYQEIVKILEIL